MLTSGVIGIMGAMPEEVNGVLALVQNPVSKTIGMRKYTAGTINGTAVVVVFSRWGKVAAAATVATLIAEFKITELIFTGVAGAVAPAVNIGDVIIATRLIQHDMDARPLMQQYEIPLLEKTYFEVKQEKIESAEKAVSKTVSDSNLRHIIGENHLTRFNINTPAIHKGDIASGDTFFASNTAKEHLYNALPNVFCVEMEGAAVAQVCYEYKIPFTVIRIISDVADDNSHIDFPAFVKNIASKYSVSIIENILLAK